MTRSVRYTVQAPKKYFEAHLAVRVEDGLNRDLTRAVGATQSPQPHNRPYKLEADKVCRAGGGGRVHTGRGQHADAGDCPLL